MAPQQISPLWQPLLDDIVEWAKPNPIDTPDFKLGSIQGRAGDDISISIPFAIWAALSRSNPDMLVIHSLPQLIAKPVFDKREQWDTNPSKFGLSTFEFSALLQVLKQNTAPPEESLQPAGWQNYVLPTQVLIILDIDNDVSVELALVVAAALTWCCGTTGDAGRAAVSQAAPARQASTRLLTLSSQPLHPLLRSFLKVFAEDIRHFTLPPLRVVRYNNVDSSKSAMTALIETVQRLPTGASHTVICFNPDVDVPEGWEEIEEEYLYYWLWHADGHHRRILFLSQEQPKFGRLTGSDYMHLVIGNTRRRAIFDRRTTQAVQADLLLSNSELARQREWVDFFDIDESSIYVYQDEPARTAIPYQPANAASSGMAAFFVGLVDFPHWHPGALLWAFDAVGQTDPDARIEVERQLHQRQLLTFNWPLRLVRLAQGLGAATRLLHCLLPPVDYNERLAHFMASPSMTDRVTLVKAQVAAALTFSLDKLVDDFEPTLGQVMAAGSRGLTSHICQLGTIWMLVALVVKALHIVDTTDDFVDMRPSSVTLVDGSLDIMVNPGAHQVRQLTLSLGDTYVRCNVPMAPMSWVEGDAIDQDELDNLYRDLLMAFGHQIAICRLTENGIVQMIDLASRQPLHLTTFAWSMIDWHYISASSDNGVFIGVYTSAHRESASSLFCIEDWTWIPGRIVEEWIAWIRIRSLRELRGVYPVHANEGEI
ncbi:hypothetical protein EDB81DRAFT_891200 [Dactylonectria macrodidyma]|uniref:Uncharacterized protein n=1 Tax=Dactylonectria macrodidyma TaxID=307937 RepID=A0A9P9DMH5_9HYPO|nr:hypothetical protein EDB81DRAFT_891200 [Dactylonectria macrodidyma]